MEKSPRIFYRKYRIWYGYYVKFLEGMTSCLEQQDQNQVLLKTVALIPFLTVVKIWQGRE